MLTRGPLVIREVQVWLDKMFRRYENDGFAFVGGCREG